MALHDEIELLAQVDVVLHEQRIPVGFCVGEFPSCIMGKTLLFGFENNIFVFVLLLKLFSPFMPLGGRFNTVFQLWISCWAMQLF